MTVKLWHLFFNREVTHETQPNHDERECNAAEAASKLLVLRRPNGNQGKPPKLDSARFANGRSIGAPVPPLSESEFRLLRFAAESNAETVREQQQEIARLQGLLDAAGIDYERSR